jgi:hypothetical protein
MCGDREVGGLAPLRPGLGKPVRGQRRPSNHRTGCLYQRASCRPGRRSQPRQRRLGVHAFAVDEDLDGLLDHRPVRQGCLQLVGQPAGDRRRDRGH